jgi:hypothetical protein
MALFMRYDAMALMDWSLAAEFIHVFALVPSYISVTSHHSPMLMHIRYVLGWPSSA